MKLANHVIYFACLLSLCMSMLVVAGSKYRSRTSKVSKPEVQQQMIPPPPPIPAKKKQVIPPPPVEEEAPPYPLEEEAPPYPVDEDVPPPPAEEPEAIYAVPPIPAGVAPYSPPVAKAPELQRQASTPFNAKLQFLLDDYHDRIFTRNVAWQYTPGSFKLVETFHTILKADPTIQESLPGLIEADVYDLSAIHADEKVEKDWYEFMKKLSKLLKIKTPDWVK